MATLADKLSGAVRWGDNPAFLVGDGGGGGNGWFSASISVQSNESNGLVITEEFLTLSYPFIFTHCSDDDA